MKFPAFLLSLIVLSVTLSAAGQEDVEAKHAAYYRCINNIEVAPYEAYARCTEYLKAYPNDDPRLVEFAAMFVKAFDNISAYLKSVPRESFTDISPEWAVYLPDLPKTLPEINEPEGKYKIVIHRDFKSAKEENLLRKAEALYGSPEETEQELFKNWRNMANPQAAPPLGEPKWGYSGNDSIPTTTIVTTSAVLYYYHASLSMRKNNGKIPDNGFTFISSNLKYDAAIKRNDKFERGGKKFENVYVANITLTWGEMCGGLCGAGFTRNKVVVLNEKGDILALFLDDPVNGSHWVS
jgi:hypothetical protein